MSALDVMTLCTAAVLATKRISRSPSSGAVIVESYGKAKHFYFAEANVNSIDDILGWLNRLATWDRTFVVRGSALCPNNNAPLPRRLHARTDEPATIEACPRRWVALDVDKLAIPDHLDVNDDPDSVIDYVMQLLPEPFRSVTVVYQFTASQSLPGRSGLSVRLWYWLDRPVSDAELEAVFADAPVDDCLFNPVQAHYTAAPIFDKATITDPVARRLGIIEGEEREVSVPEIAPLPRVASSSLVGVPIIGESTHGYENNARLIGDHAEGRGFFRPVKRAAASWIATQGSTSDTAWLRADLERRILAAYADPLKRDAAYIEMRVRDLDFLIPAVLRLQLKKEGKA